MPKGLRNVGPTFYRITKATLKDQVGRNVLSYVDEIVVASKKKENYISDLTETFTNMREANSSLMQRSAYLKSEGPEKVTRVGMNESQSKFLTGTWPIS
jgi:hypothetical protein